MHFTPHSETSRAYHLNSAYLSSSLILAAIAAAAACNAAEQQERKSGCQSEGGPRLYLKPVGYKPPMRVLGKKNLTSGMTNGVLSSERCCKQDNKMPVCEARFFMTSIFGLLRCLSENLNTSRILQCIAYRVEIV